MVNTKYQIRCLNTCQIKFISFSAKTAEVVITFDDFFDKFFVLLFFWVGRICFVPNFFEDVIKTNPCQF